MSSNEYLNSHALQFEKNANRQFEKLGVEIGLRLVPEQD